MPATGAASGPGPGPSPSPGPKPGPESMLDTTNPSIQDDKTPLCVPFLLTLLKQHQQSHDPASPEASPPLMVGLNGLQGIGKTTLVRALATCLESRGVPTLVCSIDDFYLPYLAQRALAAANPTNALLSHRGEPGTHDISLLRFFFDAVRARRTVRVPRYDKAAFNGQGDRLPADEWHREVNVPGDESSYPQIFILEGWCVGFRALDDDNELERRWRDPTARTLGTHKLEDLKFVNDQLRAYDAVTDALDAFIHLDSEDLLVVYRWRREQEAELRRERGPGAGMTDEQIDAFVDGYFPAYELYADGVRHGVFRPEGSRPGRQLRIVVDRDRRVKESIVI